MQRQRSLCTGTLCASAQASLAVLQGRSRHSQWEMAEGAAAEVDPQAMLQKVRSTVIQETPLSTAGDKCFCCVLGLSDQA